MKPSRWSVAPLPKFIATILMICLAVSVPAAAQTSAATPDVVIKIIRLEETLNLIDKLAAEQTGKTDGSLTAVARGSLMGTAWIDSGRPTLVGIAFENGSAKTTVLIPFVEPNADFQSSYGAKTGLDYYLLNLPPGTEAPVTAEMEKALLEAGTKPQNKLITMQVALQRLIEKNRDAVDRLLTRIEQPASTSDAPQPTPPINSEEIRETLKRTVDILQQVETLTVDFDLTNENVGLGYRVLAAAGSRLAEIFVAGGNTVSLPVSSEPAQIQFASRSYNLAGVLALLGDNFGNIYKKLGIDLAGLEKISRGFTGEMVGGMNLKEDHLEFEFMAMLSESVSPEDFLEKEYLPWLVEYGRQMRAVAQAAGDATIPEPVTLTEESAVGENRVLGCRIAMPMAGVPGPGVALSTLPITDYEMRMTTVGPVLAIASSDSLMPRLIEKAGSINSRPAEAAPMMTAEVDLASYLATLRSWAQKQGGQLPPLPALGKIRFEGDMNDGQASFGMSLGVKDLTALASYVAALKPAAAKASAGGEESKTSSEKKPETSEATAVPAGKLKVPPKREAVEVENSAEYWANRAYLCTTYGNDEAAIRFFKKAIALSPKSSNLYFQMGISYAELGYYQASLAAIDKAIDLGGPKGLYYFGRGRVLIQSGKKEQGLAEIQKAAGMGDPDALQYLQDLEKRPAG